MNHADAVFLPLPEGAVLLKDMDEASARRMAVRLGLHSAIEAVLQDANGPCAASVLQRDGDWLRGVYAWQGFRFWKGWATLSISPVNEKTALFMLKITRMLVDGDVPPCL